MAKRKQTQSTKGREKVWRVRAARGEGRGEGRGGGGAGHAGPAGGRAGRAGSAVALTVRAVGESDPLGR